METTTDSMSNPGYTALPQLTSKSVSYLKVTSQWSKFLAIIGFIGIGFIFVLGIFFGIASSMFREYMPAFLPINPTIFILIYILIGIVYLFPVIYLNNFANQTLRAIDFGDTTLMNSAFNNLKRMFVYLGIATITFISLYILAILAMITGFFVMTRSL
jgi:hypothetical protein